MNVLIVYAHPEPASMNGALKDCAVETLEADGHHVEVSDLHAMKFEAVATADDFQVVQNESFFKYQVEQAKTHTNQTGYCAEIEAEHRKLDKADLLVFQFPLWWFSVPAILKGWVDRVFAAGYCYGGGKIFETGGFAGKKAMLSLTTGGLPDRFTKDALYGDIHDIVRHIEYGMLAFTGFTVLPPFVVHGPAKIGQDERERHLRAYAAQLRAIGANHS
ncbi:MAG: NAD(P)H-dependent oxidoreductase [Roseitalea sp.]|jgi:NAD(P)H dehydrogenase (quinone)|nr:NAD(P)H-dependent oxidoreductase [Roseitalea sp.]MBO6720815.1 NAD(P)H-dependent oxidoreductase [Roseitalea sp.]MBO6743962.1 NAD(P)H-dependent oxidoreductase [Roseitalea sp.]